MKFSDNLVKYRKKAGLTQGQLAAKLSVTPQAVSKWEKGSYPDSELLPELSKALDVSLDVLFGLKSDDGKINATNAAAKKMRSLSDEDKGQFIMELFYSLICTYNPNTDAENISFPESLARETYAHLRSDHALAVSRLNPDMQYICFMRVPEDGINSYFKIQPRIMELFSILSDENALRIINFAETVERNYQWKSFPKLWRNLTVSALCGNSPPTQAAVLSLFTAMYTIFPLSGYLFLQIRS